MPSPPFDYWPLIGRPRLEWPNGARLAVWIGVNVERYEVDRPAVAINPSTVAMQPDPINYSWREYGARVGIWRLMELLDEVGLRASVLLNSDVCAAYPQIVAEGNKRGWAWLAHGKNNSQKWNTLSLEEERVAAAEVVSTIRQATGKMVKGWLGPAGTESYNTVDVLAELGLTYVCDWTADDQPFPLNSQSGRMISVPYTPEVNDLPIFAGKTVSGSAYYEIVRDHFDVMYAQAATSGLVLCLGIHPFIINQPYRHKYFAQVLRYVAGHAEVWLTTSDEIADWYFERYYDQAVASVAAANAGRDR